jgi:putative transposase
MKKDVQQERRWAVQRFFEGESPDAICVSLGRSRAWLYKWVERSLQDEPLWQISRSRRPHTNSLHTPGEIEEIVKIVRLNLYNRGLFCGDQAIHWELEEMGVRPLPSLRTLNRILNRHGLTHRRTGKYEPKGKLYPVPPALMPNQTHQADFVGPRHLKGPFRFYSLNSVDITTGRCAVQPLQSRTGQNIIDSFWAIWIRMGIPDNVQVDNEISFFGSPMYPRGMGPLIRLCLHHNVEPWFIPPAEPWRNGVIEKFNDHYQQKFLNRVMMTTEAELKQASLGFEHKHNSCYRYSKLRGQTPMQALSGANRTLKFPDQKQAPQYPLKKPKTGKYHLVRYIRSNSRLNIFGEIFPVSPELQYEYVVATIDVKEQKLKLFLANEQVDEFNYLL